MSEASERIEAFQKAAQELREAVGQVVVGQAQVVEEVLVCLFAGGHALLEGAPGLGKTLLIRTLSEAMHLDFSRIQFTPDLMPSDIVGTNMVVEDEHGRKRFELQRGPIFGQLVLADEINRAPAKVQSALLEAMQELQVTIGDQTHKLEAPFMVMATQNPVEQEGTYPLAEAQVDRFMLHVTVDYPTPEEERTIMERMASHVLKDPSPAEEAVTPDPLAIRAVATPRQLLEARRTIGHVYMDEKIKDYIIDVVTSTRDPQRVGLGDLRDMIAHGASPRASIALNVAARAHAFLKHRGYVTPEDVKAVGHDVLRHRIIRTYEAEAEEITSEHLVRRIFEAVEVP